MLADRVKVVLILLPIGLVVFILGGIVYTAAIALVLALAGWEYTRLFQAGGLQASGVLVIISVVALSVSRALDDFSSAPWIIALIILVSMAYHLVRFERGRQEAGTDFAVTLSGSLYFGWLGAYLISIRALPDGLWWLLLTLVSVWIADSGAYFVGRRFGKHKMSPRLSPKKTWEGFVGGIVAGTLGGLLIAALFRALPWSGENIAVWHGAVLGFALAVITPLGDLGESMVKRQVGVKDSGKLLPGHGGAWDRIELVAVGRSDWLLSDYCGFPAVRLSYIYPYLLKILSFLQAQLTSLTGDGIIGAQNRMPRTALLSREVEGTAL